MKKIALFVAAVLCITAFCANDELDENGFPIPYVLVKHEANAAEYPAELLDWESCKVGNLMDEEIRHLSFTLKNITQAPIKIKAIRPACPCLKFNDTIADIELKPQEKYTANFDILGTKLKPGEFLKSVIVEIENAKIATMSISGTVVEMVEFEPSAAIDLGTFVGDVPWKRCIDLKTHFESEDVKVLPPEKDSKYFNFTIIKQNKNLFTVEITPKMPFPKSTKTFREVIHLPVQGVPNYGPIEIGVKGQATGWLFSITKDTLYLPKTSIKNEEAIEVETMLILKNDKPAQEIHKTNKPEPIIKLVSMSVAEEEDLVHPTSDPATWVKLLDLVEVQAPLDVLVSKIPSEGGMILHVSIPAGFFKNGRPITPISVFCGKKNIGMIKFKTR